MFSSIDGASAGNILSLEPMILYVPLGTIFGYASYTYWGFRFLRRGLERKLLNIIPVPLLVTLSFAAFLFLKNHM